MAKATAAEKDPWLQYLAPLDRVGLLQSHRMLRDELVAQGYANAQGLQARQWKCALKDAIETADKNWKALFAELALWCLPTATSMTTRNTPASG